MITHSNVTTFVAWALKHFGIDHTDRFSGHTPFHFDLSTFDIFGSITAGAAASPGAAELTALLPPKLVEFIRTSQLTQWFSVPSVLNYVAKFNCAAARRLSRSLRRVLWCGEVLPTPALIYWMKHLPHVPFHESLRPHGSHHRQQLLRRAGLPARPEIQIPIGRACDGEELLVLDDEFEPVPAREIGDLYIARRRSEPRLLARPGENCRCLPPGPFDRPTPSATRSIAPAISPGRTNTACVYFVGRADTQIKVRGYRIELGEIETALNSCGSLQECAVVAIQTDNFGGWMICAAYVLRGGEQATLRLRKHLKKLVPGYMLPVRWTAYPALPKNANGKIDRPSPERSVCAERKRGEKREDKRSCRCKF